MKRVKKYHILILCFVLCLVAAAIILLVKGSLRSKEKTEKDMFQGVDMSYFQKYDNQSYQIDGYKISLKYGVYSEKSKNGVCIFEVECEGGRMPDLNYVDKNNRILGFGGGQASSNQYAVRLNATGTITTRAKMEQEKLILYTYFTASSIDPQGEECYNAHQIYIDYANARSDIDPSWDYGFKLEDNAQGKEFKIDEDTSLNLSYLGIRVFSNKKLDTFKMEFVNKKGKKKVLFNMDKKADIKGSYGESYSEDNGVEEFVYTYDFNDIFDVNKIEELYINGEKIF